MTDRRPGFVAVLDYGIGNLRSAQKALCHLGVDARLVTRRDEAAGAAAVVLPGVGAFGRCAEALRGSGLDRVASEAIDACVPFLGICVGFQLLYSSSEESPDARGLGILPGQVRALPAGVKHPQMQWNRLQPVVCPDGHKSEPDMLAGTGSEAWVYFVHSYAPERSDWDVATVDYGGPVVAAVEMDNVWGTQFHPVKSGRTGMSILGNFLRLAGAPTPAQTATREQAEPTEPTEQTEPTEPTEPMTS